MCAHAVLRQLLTCPHVLLQQPNLEEPSNNAKLEVMRSRDLALGDRVVHARTHRAGVVRYFGPVEEAHGSAGNMVGVEYDEPVVETDSHSDMHDGSYRGVQYFNGKQGYVLF